MSLIEALTQFYLTKHFAGGFGEGGVARPDVLELRVFSEVLCLLIQARVAI
jgi:hypothetical protein